MRKVLIKLIITVLIIVFANNSNIIAQNTPANATHLLSISEGLRAPFRIAVNNDGIIYVTDVSQRNVVKFDKSFNYIGSLNVGNKPTSIAINSSDEVFIGDSETGAIYKLDGAENPIIFSSVINRPLSMVFDNDDLLYVVDSKLKQVTVLDESGNYVRSIGAGDIIQPTAITFDSENDRLLVAEHGGIGAIIGGGMMGGGYPLTQIWIFDINANQLGTIAEGGSDEGQFYRIQGMSFSKTGAIFVTDPYQASISIFAEDGTFLSKFGDYGKSAGELNIPMDVAFDSQGRTLVTSMNTGKIEVYYINEINPTYEINAVKEVLCPGENTDIEVSFTGNGPWSFTYTKDGLTPITVTDTYTNPYAFNVTEAGIYELTELSDANYNAIDFSNKATITANPFPTSSITSGDVELCPGTNTDVLISFTGVAPYTFTYTDGTTSKTIYDNEINPYIINTSENASYKVTYLRDAGYCLAQDLSDIANISINSLPSSVITSEDVVICEGSSTDISIDFTGTAPWTFTYTIDGANPTTVSDTYDNPYILTTSTSGLYSVSALSDVSNTGACFTGSTNITVTPIPTSNIITNNITTCEGSSANINIELTGSAPWDLTYTVDGINPVSVTGINSSPYFLETQETGLHEITALTDNKCLGTSFTGSTQVITAPFPSSTMTSGDEKFTICRSETKDFTVELTGTAPWTFKYIIDDSNPITINTNNSLYTLTSSLAGTYEIVEISDLYCQSTDSHGFPIIEFKELPVINLGPDILICEGETTTIDAGTFANYLWNNGSTSQTLDVSSEGNYILNVTDANGCTNSDEIFVAVQPLPISDFTFSKDNMEVSFFNNSQNSDSYLWDFGDSNTSIETNPIHTYLSSGNFDITLKASDDMCGDNTIVKTINIAGTSIDDIALKDKYNIYPIPSDGIITIELEKPVQSVLQVEVTNLYGQSVYSNFLQPQKSKIHIDLNNLPKGIYSLNLISKEWNQSKKIILSN